MAKNGKLNKHDMETLNKALNILRWWSEWAENDGFDDNEVSGWQFDMAMSAEASLREFIDSYEI